MKAYKAWHFALSAGLAMAVSTLLTEASIAATINRTTLNTGAIHDTGDNGNPDYYASGNDDNFGEYGIATYQFTASDFGVASVATIDSVEHILTHNERTFSQGDSVLFYYSPDSFDASFSGLTYDDSVGSVGGLNTSQFSSIFSLGSYSYTPQTGGTQTTYTLDFSDPATSASLVDQINNGSEFQILIVAEELSDTVTYSGLNNTFDPGDPQLSISASAATAVPEPTTILGTLTALGYGILFKRRSKLKNKKQR